MVTIPAGLPRRLRSVFQRALSRRWTRQAWSMSAGSWPRWRMASWPPTAGVRRECSAASTSSRRAWVEPALVILPSRRLWPELYSEGTSPTYLADRVGMVEAVPVADLRAQPERGQRVGAAQTAQPGDRLAPDAVRRDLLELAGDQL